MKTEHIFLAGALVVATATALGMASASSASVTTARSALSGVPTDGQYPPPPPNKPPCCDDAEASPDTLWPPNHKYEDIQITGVTDPDHDPVKITITSIKQDEPTNTVGDGNTCPDAEGVGTSSASVRAERTGNPNVPGDGRVYYINFIAKDKHGAKCTGTVEVCVPHDQGNGSECVGGGPLYDSTEC